MSDGTVRLGGVTPIPWLSKAKIVTLTLLTVLGVVMMILVIEVQSIWMVLALAVVIGLFVVVLRRRSSDGAVWVLGIGERIRHAIGRRARWDDFDPELEDQPWLLMQPLRVVGVPAGDGSELAVLEYPGSMVCILEISGNGHGVKAAEEHHREDSRVIAVHRALADPKVCVEQVDWLTLVRPEHPDAIAASMNELAEDQPDPLVVSAAELPWRVADKSERFFSYLVVRFDTNRLFEKVAQPPFTESSGVEAAYDAAGHVARILNGKGITVVSALGPGEVSALTRAILAPHRSPNDLDGCNRGFWDSCPAWTREQDLIRTEDGDQQWWHTTAAFGLHDWPIAPVRGRWLEPLVFGFGLGPRTVISQIKMVPRYKAREFAKSQLTTAQSKRLERARKGEVDGGEAWSEESVATDVAQDIILHGQLGIIPAVRVLVSGQSPRQTRQLREEVGTVAGDAMNGEGITYDDTRPGVGLLHCLPLGMEVPNR